MAQDRTRPLAGLMAVVTGSSSGIGRAIAFEFAHSGADVLVHARRSADAANEVAAAIEAAGTKSKVELSDFAERGGVERFVEAAWKWQGHVDIWVNNAGADVLTGEAASWDFNAKLTALWMVDVVATMRLSRGVGERMKKRGSGVILNMGWDATDRGMEGDSGELFAATKGAVAAFSRSLAKSLAPEVRVNCLAPGWIKTSWGAGASEAWQERAQRESLMGRWGTPEDVARTAAFLASPDASFISGQVVAINGGYR